jgi:hypothetical protein
MSSDERPLRLLSLGMDAIISIFKLQWSAEAASSYADYYFQTVVVSAASRAS